MIPLKLEINNLFAYDRQKINFTKFDGPILIKGRNNSGKSAIIDCISYILFDTLTRLTKPSDDIIRKGEEVGYGILEFKIGKTRYRVDRGRRKSKPYCHFKNLSRDKELTERKVADTNQKIVNRIGMNFNIFRNSILFGQGDNSRFVNMTDVGRKSIFCSLIKQLNEIEEYYQTVKDKTTAKEDKLNDLVLSVGSPKKIGIQILQENYHKKKAEKKYKQLQGKIKKLEGKLVNTEILDELDTNLRKIENKLTNRIDRLHIEESWVSNTAERSKEKIVVYKEEMNNIKKGKCPTCNQSFPKKTMKKKIEDLEDKIKSCLKIKKKAEKEREDDISNLKKEVKQLMKRKEEAWIKFRDEKKKTKNSNMKKFKKYNTESGEIYSSIEQHKETLKDLKERLKTEEKTQTKIKKLNKQVRDLSIIESGLHKTGIQQDIIDDLLPVFEEKVKYYLNQLCDGISVKFSTTVKSKDGSKDLDKFSILVYNGKDRINYNLIGGGLKKRIQIAISFALSDFALEQSGISTDFILLDEVFGELDDVGRDSVIKLLRNLRKRFKKMIIISHITEVQDLIKQHIEVKQTNGISRIVA